MLPASKNEEGTKAGKAAWELQQALPNACVLYVSATSSPTVRSLAPMDRLCITRNPGLGTPYKDFQEFQKTVFNSEDKRVQTGVEDVKMMEIVGRELYARGLYVARMISFQDVTFEVKQTDLPATFEKDYDSVVALQWHILDKLQALVPSEIDVGRRVKLSPRYKSRKGRRSSSFYFAPSSDDDSSGEECSEEVVQSSDDDSDAPPMETSSKSKRKKNAPVEMSSKKPVSRFMQVVPKPANSFRPRDPRYEEVTGDYSEHHFRSNYSFLQEVEEGESKETEKALKKVKNQTKKQFLQQRQKEQTNQQKVQRDADRQYTLKQLQKKQSWAQVKAGKNPYYLKKADEKQLGLGRKYLELKQSGKLNKFLQKKRKKDSNKDHRWVPYSRRE